MRRTLFVILATLALVALLVGPAWAAKPNIGKYTGVVPGAPDGYDGWVRVKETAIGGRVLAAWGGALPGIVAPSDGTCNYSAAYLTPPKIPVKQGVFEYRGVEVIGPDASERTVIFKGTFVTRTKATGTTRIKGDGCDSGTDAWTMKLET
jgi:hypothetical protein